MNSKLFAKDLLKYIDKSPSVFHVIEESKKLLEEKNFEELDIRKSWNIKKGGNYFVTVNESSIIAFMVNTENIEEEGFRIIGSHSDSPCFRIKPKTEIIAENTYIKLNTECYGGAILSTWMDRPLGIAGRVMLRGKNILQPESVIINMNKPVCIIPNIAIHMNREVNEGYKLNKQIDMLPLLGIINENFEKDNFLLKEVCKETDIDINEIIDFDLYLYEYENGSLIGLNEEFISSSRLDNLTMAHASLKALLDSNGNKGINVVAVFDNEEVGSSTRQGADSNMLLNTLERICLALGKNREQFFESIYSSFMISADLAHAVHPNMTSKHDPTNRPTLGKGPVIKISANKSYTSDAYSSTIYKSICQNSGVQYQEFVNKSDERGGSTIGPISSTHLDIASVDVGTPILAMHSIRELGHVEDHLNIYKTFCEFYSI